MQVFKGFCAGLAVGLTLALWVRSQRTMSTDTVTDALNEEFAQIWRSRPASDRMASHLRLTRNGYQLNDAGEIIGNREDQNLDEGDELL